VVLNRIREKIDPILSSLGKSIGQTGISPNALTFIGFGFAMLAGLLFAFRTSMPYLAGLAIIASGFFDIVDGAVARYTSKISKKGSFTDSTLDRLSEVFIFAGIIYAGYGAPSFIVLLALGFSLLVSYLRAKSESLNIKISGIGIGERAERLVALAIFSIIGYVSYGVYVVLVLAAVTFVQRYLYSTRALGRN
jgi:archaetidylinositol phosphate synthase